MCRGRVVNRGLGLLTTGGSWWREGEGKVRGDKKEEGNRARERERGTRRGGEWREGE